MAKGKLILICQYGGQFITNSDGSMSYTGGEANALEINHETLFDDLKLKLAEMWNLDYRSLSIKYFLPLNKRTLINLTNDKDLKRMYDFHGASVTADVYVMGREGFDPQSLRDHANRTNGIKLAETLATDTAAATTAFVVAGAPVDSLIDIAVIDHNPPAVSTQSKAAPHNASRKITRSASANSTLPDLVTDAVDSKALLPTQVDMSSTPADTVKKRRRTTALKSIDSAPDIGSKIDVVGGTGKGTSRKKKIQKHLIPSVAVDEEQREIAAPWSDNLVDCPVVAGSDLSLEALVAAWREGITGEGQEFKSVREFRDALQKYAIANRFAYKLKKNDSNRASGICVIEGCSWRIHASWVPSSQSFVVKRMNKSHTCGGESWKAAHPAKNWLVNIIKDRLRDSPHHKPKEIAQGIARDFGIELNYSQVWRGIEDAREQLQGSYKDAYGQLPLFCEKVVEANPGSLANLFTDDDGRFQHLFVSFRALIQGFNDGCHPLVFLDSISFKSKYHEVFLTASAVDGDDGPFPLAFAIVDVEDDSNWCRFLEQLRSAFSTSTPITFISDHEKGLETSVHQVFENGHHGYSIFHLVENFKKNVKGPFTGDGKGFLISSLLAAARAQRLDTFTSYVEQMKKVSSKAYDWIMQIEPDKWAHASFKGEPFHFITVDIADPYAQWIEEVKELPIVQKVEALISKLVELFNARRTNSSNWFTTLTPSREEKLREESRRATSLKVLFSSDTIFEVHDNSINVVVDLQKRVCSCLEWKPSGLPCCHAIAVFYCTGKNSYDYCPKCFTVDCYLATYFDSINPVWGPYEKSTKGKDPSQTMHVLPPSTPKPSTEQNKKQHTKTEGVTKRGVCCSRCGGVGHNKSTCKETLQTLI
ncbi:uncharacterized protein LOC115687388 [Syzygium oleosum]|uniref:uncharacterized protein LOC115687388 n=1 Tax=Syzygium oleosum TaxID=219896 RepID=UPI0024B9879B|nr:uncharacterized protein LOC115687388 [Syzygium oleosum]XP_030468785.2 uncharacterized protein LOC115687388 [Syzygium oleosum]